MNFFGRAAHHDWHECGMQHGAALHMPCSFSMPGNISCCSNIAEMVPHQAQLQCSEAAKRDVQVASHNGIAFHLDVLRYTAALVWPKARKALLTSIPAIPAAYGAPHVYCTMALRRCMTCEQQQTATSSPPTQVHTARINPHVITVWQTGSSSVQCTCQHDVHSLPPGAQLTL
jgi:hypothetical protein